MGSWSFFMFVVMCGGMGIMAHHVNGGGGEKALRSKRDEVRIVVVRHHDCG